MIFRVWVHVESNYVSMLWIAFLWIEGLLNGKKFSKLFSSGVPKIIYNLAPEVCLYAWAECRKKNT